MEHQNNEKGPGYGLNHEHDDYDIDEQRHFVTDKGDARDYGGYQRQGQDRSRGMPPPPQRANQRAGNGVTVIERRIPPPPPPPQYSNYRTAERQPRARRSDDNIAYNVCLYVHNFSISFFHGECNYKWLTLKINTPSLWL